MRRTKKLAALVLAMVMAFSIMSVTAAAQGDAGHTHTAVCSEGSIMPRIPAMECTDCHVDMIYEVDGPQYRFVCPVCHDKTPWMFK